MIKKERERTEERINELDRSCSIRTTGKKIDKKFNRTTGTCGTIIHDVIFVSLETWKKKRKRWD